MNAPSVRPAPAASSRRSFALTVLFGAAAAGVYLFAVQPAGDALRKAQLELADGDAKLGLVNANLKDSSRTQARLDALDRELRPFRDETLEPLLASYAMRAKSIVEPLALAAGLTRLDYAEGKLRTLPAPAPAPRQLHGRKAISISAQGSYMAAVSFLMRMEREHPLVALQSLTVSATSKPAVQQIEMTLEWPAKGGATK